MAGGIQSRVSQDAIKSTARDPKCAIDVFRTGEKWLLQGLVIILVAFALLQIVLRNFFSTGVIWGDTFLRHVVLWIGLIGAARATAEDKHIHIDLLPRIFSTRLTNYINIITRFITFLVSAILFYASFRFVSNEASTGGIAFANVPLWCIEIIFPLSFAVMTVRFWCRVVADVRALSSRGEGL